MACLPKCGYAPLRGWPGGRAAAAVAVTLAVLSPACGHAWTPTVPRCGRGTEAGDPSLLGGEPRRGQLTRSVEGAATWTSRGPAAGTPRGVRGHCSASHDQHDRLSMGAAPSMAIAAGRCCRQRQPHVTRGGVRFPGAPRRRRHGADLAGVRTHLHPRGPQGVAGAAGPVSEHTRNSRLRYRCSVSYSERRLLERYFPRGTHFCSSTKKAAGLMWTTRAVHRRRSPELRGKPASTPPGSAARPFRIAHTGAMFERIFFGDRAGGRQVLGAVQPCTSASWAHFPRTRRPSASLAGTSTRCSTSYSGKAGRWRGHRGLGDLVLRSTRSGSTRKQRQALWRSGTAAEQPRPPAGDAATPCRVAPGKRGAARRR